MSIRISYTTGVIKHASCIIIDIQSLLFKHSCSEIMKTIRAYIILWQTWKRQYYYYLFFLNPRIKKYPKVEQKIKEIVVAGMNTNPGGVPT